MRSVAIVVTLVLAAGCGQGSPEGRTDALVPQSEAPPRGIAASPARGTQGESSPPARPEGPGIRGTVWQHPACRLRAEPGPACTKPSQLIDATVQISRQEAGANAPTTQTEGGHFEVSVPPGEYLVQAFPKDERYSCEDRRVTVPSGEHAEVSIDCTAKGSSKVSFVTGAGSSNPQNSSRRARLP